MSNVYDFSATDIDGQPRSLSEYKGKALLIVNVASQCGFTPQYTGLESLWKTYRDRGLVVLGFPSNDFGGQEPGTEAEIKKFCSLKYHVSFPMFAKVVTKPGAGQSPVYAYLGASGHLPAWNFAKYVVGRDGRVRAFFPSDVTPESPALRTAITEALKAN